MDETQPENGEARIPIHARVSPYATENIGILSKGPAAQIGYALDLLQRDLTGDIKELKGYKFEYRLRVGPYRVRFELIGNHIIV